MTTLQLVALQLAAGGEAKKSGPIGFAVILVLCVACYFLFKSMSKHLRKVREDFPGEGTSGESGPAGSTGGAGVADGQPQPQPEPGPAAAGEPARTAEPLRKDDSRGA